jgi:uncharacterized protein
MSAIMTNTVAGWSARVLFPRHFTMLKSIVFALLIPTCAVTALIGNSALASDAPATTADVAELIHLNGAANIAGGLAPLLSSQFVAALRQSNPNLPNRAVSVTNEVIMQYLRDPAQTEQLINALIPIYAHAFSETEVRQLLEFYKTPIGRKLGASFPSISAQSAQVGAMWAERSFPELKVRLVARLRAEGLLSQ